MQIPKIWCPNSTSILRKLRDAALDKLEKDVIEKKYVIIHSITLHFFKDCILAFGEYEQGRLTIKEGELSKKTFMVYTKDMKEWKEYKNQFEPAEGFHKAIQYAPVDSSFPTKTWE